MNLNTITSKKVIASMGIVVWIITPLFISTIWDVKLIETLKSFYSLIHLMVLCSVLFLNDQSRHKIHKISVCVSFLVYPLLLTVDSTKVFGDKTFVIAFVTAWLYMMGLAGWMYTEKLFR